MHSVTRLVVTVFVSMTVLVASTGVAAADEPTTWDSGEPLSGLEFLGLLVGAPVAISLVLSVLTLLFSRRHFVPSPPSVELETSETSH